MSFRKAVLTVVLPSLTILAFHTVTPRIRAEEPEAVSFKNVEILTHVKSKKEMRVLMKEQAKALGVKCTHCHVKGDYASDDLEPKLQARSMMRMVSAINEKYFPNVTGGISCWTCHAGSREPELVRPQPPGEEATTVVAEQGK